MHAHNDTIICKNGTAVKVTFTFNSTEAATIQADCPDQQFTPDFSFIARTEDGCYAPLKGMALTLAKDGQYVQAFILQATYELYFGVSIQDKIDAAIANPDR